MLSKERDIITHFSNFLKCHFSKEMLHVGAGRITLQDPENVFIGPRNMKISNISNFLLKCDLTGGRPVDGFCSVRGLFKINN